MFSGSKYIGVRRERRARGVLDALIHREDRDVARAGEAPVVEQALQAREHADRPVGRRQICESRGRGQGGAASILGIVLHSCPRSSGASAPRMASTSVEADGRMTAVSPGKECPPRQSGRIVNDANSLIVVKDVSVARVVRTGPESLTACLRLIPGGPGAGAPPDSRAGLPACCGTRARPRESRAARRAPCRGIPRLQPPVCRRSRSRHTR